MKLIMPSYINQVWNYFTNDTGEIQVVSEEISKNATTSYDESICTLEESPESEKRAKLIMYAPDMFRTLCNIAGEVKYGNGSLPEFLMEGIDSIIDGITSKDETE